MTIANFHPAGGHAKTLPSTLTIKRKAASPLTVLMLSTLSLNAAHAALTATTAQTIKGTAPYFTLDGVQLNNTAELLGFTYTNASGTVGTKATADAAVDGTTIIVDPNMKMSDIKAMVPITDTSTPLSTLLGGDLNIADADGDALVGGASAIGAMKAYWTKDGTANYVPAANEKFTACSTYTLTIAITDPATGVVASSAGNIEASTTYGDPNNQPYAYPVTAGSTSTTIYSATYAIQPKVVTPYTCWAQPNLTNGSGAYAGPSTQWNPTKGFLPQTLPNRNFPTTGFYGAWFNLTVAGTTAANIINKMDSSASGSPLTGYVTSGDIKLKLVEASTNVVNITLFGPRDGTVTYQNETSAPTHAFTPTSFTLQDASSTNIYAFTIEKWFITRDLLIPFSAGQSGTWNASVNPPWGWNGSLDTPNYCANLGGAGSNYYKVPTRLDYTNSAAASLLAWNGTSGTGGNVASPNYYQRTIGGGVFTEWGYTHKGANGYPLSEFTIRNYSTSEPSGSNAQYVVESASGAVYGFTPFNTYKAACVSP